MALDLSPEVEQAVVERAAEEGVSVNELIARVFVRPPSLPTERVQSSTERIQHLLAQWQAVYGLPERPSGNAPQSLAELVSEWEQEDTALSQEELQEAQQEWKEFQEAINKTRSAQRMRTIF